MNPHVEMTYHCAWRMARTNNPPTVIPRVASLLLCADCKTEVDKIMPIPNPTRDPEPIESSDDIELVDEQPPKRDTWGEQVDNGNRDFI